MRFLKRRIVALVAIVIVALGVNITIAARSSGYSYAGFVKPGCVGPSNAGTNSLFDLWLLGSTSYIDNNDTTLGCLPVPTPP